MTAKRPIGLYMGLGGLALLALASASSGYREQREGESNKEWTLDQVVGRLRRFLPGIKVNSLCRDEGHNDAVGGSSTSAHLVCYAADLGNPGAGGVAALAMLADRVLPEYDQLIVAPTHLHIGAYPPEVWTNRGQVLYSPRAGVYRQAASVQAALAALGIEAVGGAMGFGV